MRRVAIIVTVLTTAVGSGVTIAQATPASRVAIASHAVVSGVKSPGRITGTHAAQYLRTTRPSMAAPRVAHLDPRLQNALPTSGNTVSVAVSGDTAQAAAHVTALGGRVLAAASGEISAIVPRAALVRLAGSQGVTSVAPPARAVDLGVVNEGVHASGADTWQGSGCSGNCGAGVKVGIVDGGFTNLAAEVTLGNLPGGTVVNGNHCANVNDTQHGTAVAEIVHQMAPQAQLFLYCVDDNVGFQMAEGEIEAQGIKIVNSSLGFPGDSRGDGSGASNSTAATVKTAREHGILWIQSAGNEGIDHWGGTLADSNNDGLVDVNGPNNEVDFVVVKYGGSASFFLQWDQWPTSGIAISLNFAPADNNGNALPGTLQIVPQSPGTSPTLGACFVPGGGGGCIDSTSPTFFPNATNQLFGVTAGITGSFPHVRFDFSYYGEVSFNQFACLTVDNAGHCTASNPRGAAQSMSEPASSPFALAVGAANVGDGTTAAGTLELFSSQGPTIDGRTKPDITGWDGVSSNLPEFSMRFYGTSSAAPHVAGAAALVAAANPSMDPAQIQTFLEQRASSGAPHNPPTNQLGHGLLTLGANSGVTPPTAVDYMPVTPQRILDTRPTALGAGALGVKTVNLPAGVPSTAKAVAINLTGVGATAATNLRVYPGAIAPGTSNLNLDTSDRTEAVFAIVTVGAGKTITVRNQAGQVNVLIDLLGYFDASGSDKYSPLAPKRAYDSRVSHGGAGPFGGGTKRPVQTAPLGVPVGAVEAVVNVTSVNSAGSGDLRLSSDCSVTAPTSTLNFNTRTRANMAFAPLNVADGSFCIQADGATTDVLVDVVGYIGTTGAAGYVALPSPVRIMDTRSGNQSPVGLVGAMQERTVFGAGIFGVPYVVSGTSGLLLGVTGVSPTAGTDLEVFPGTVRPSPPTSTLNLVAGEVVPNAAVAGLNSSLFSVYNSSGSIAIIVDLFGYFA